MGFHQKKFRNSSGTLQEQFGNKAIVFLLLVIFNKDFTAKEASKMLNVSERTIREYIKKLRDRNYIERVGSATFGGYWALKKD